AFSAIKNNDRVALTLFTDGVEKFVPPRKGSRHVLRIIRELLYCEPIGHGTSLKKALEHLNRTARRRAVVFLISDFQDAGYLRTLNSACRRHDVIRVVIADKRELTMPNVGLVRLRDAETGQMVTFDTFSRANRRAYEEHARRRMQQRDTLFRRLRLDPIHVYTGEDFVEPLQRFFHRREKQR
ncbi:MAG: VWA domain-containing protein, partial [Planctomycetales bacterium]|nr:VWA domain-containing protein [Planctomycetales bacterium]